MKRTETWQFKGWYVTETAPREWLVCRGNHSVPIRKMQTHTCDQEEFYYLMMDRI